MGIFKYFLSREVEGPGPMTPSNPCKMQEGATSRRIYPGR